MVEENVRIKIEVIDKAGRPVKELSDKFRSLNKFTGVQTEITKTLNERTGKQNRIIRKTTTGVKSFNFAWLSVMFAGMALTRVFGGLIKSQLQLFGITDLFSATLTLVMLPVMQLLLPLFFKLSEIFLNMPDGLKLAIGIFILLGFVFGLILSVVGSIMLAIGGFVSLWIGLGAVGAGAGAIILGAMSTVLIIIGAIILIVILLFSAWKKNFGGMRNFVSLFVEDIKNLFKSMFRGIMGVFKIFKGIFMGDWSLVKEGIVQIWNAFKLFWKSLFFSLVDFFAIIVLTIGNLFVNLGKVIWGALVSAKNIARNAWFNFINWITRKLSFLGDKIRNIVNRFRSAVGLGNSSRGSSRRVNDFILQPGGRLIETDPRDTIVGFKGGGGAGSVSGGGVTINNTNTFNVSDKAEMQRMIESNNSRLVEDIKRQIGV